MTMEDRRSGAARIRFVGATVWAAKIVADADDRFERPFISLDVRDSLKLMSLKLAANLLKALSSVDRVESNTEKLL